MLCRFSYDHFALKKCRHLHIAIKKFGYQAFNEYCADYLIIACIFEK